MRKWVLRLAIAAFVFFGGVAMLPIGSRLSVGVTAEQQRASVPPKRSGAAYDTPAEREAKKKALLFWCIEEGNSSHDSPCDGRKEYALKVLEIVKRWPPHNITYAMYKELVTDDENGNFLADGWLTTGALPDELSRSTAGDMEIVIYRWKNPNGSNIVGTYHNGHLVSKAQAGLK